MGNSNSLLIYSMPSSPPESSFETDIYRHPKNNGHFSSTFEGKNTLQSIFLDSVSKFPNNPLFGSRDSEGTYHFQNYKEIYESAFALGKAIIQDNLFNEIEEDLKNRKLKLLGVFSKNCSNWVLTDIASMLFGITTVPFYETLGAESLRSILIQTKITSLFCSIQSLESILLISDLHNLKNIILFEKAQQTKELMIISRNLNLIYFEDLIKKGQSIQLEMPKVTPDIIYTISYTSGLESDPKGVMISHKNMVSSLDSSNYSELKIESSDLHLSYLPLAHIYERMTVNICIAKGSAIGFYSGEVNKLKLDLFDLKPTFFTSVPRLYNKFAEILNANSNSSSNFITKYLTNRRMKSIFGGRVKFLLSASAPISSKVLNFLKSVCNCPFLEAYGLTESCGLSFITKINEDCKGKVGGPCFNVEFKLVDVPEMGYFSTVKNGNPRGEIYLRGPPICEGYFNDFTGNQEIFDKLGWLKTGDIAELDITNGAISIIDRKKHIFKLAQGEYVSPQKLEKIYLKCECCEEIIVYGDSLQAFVVAIMKPRKSWIENIAKIMNIEGDYLNLVKNKEVKEIVLKLLEKEGNNAKLTRFEMVKKVTLIADNFMDKGVQSNTYKLRRHIAKQIFKKEIDEMYEE